MTPPSAPPDGGLVIPRVIHRIWLGGDPMPAAFQRYGESWRGHHPDWEMRLWTDDQLPVLRRPQGLHRARHLAERANVLRYEVLASLGGVYVDTDMECLRSIEPLLAGIEAFAAYQRPGEVCNAILGAVPGHPAFQRAVDEVAARAGEGVSSVAATGPGFLTELLAGFPGVTIFESETFYPYDWEEEPRPASELPRAYAIHHWSRTGKEPLDPAARIDYLRDRVTSLRRQRVKAKQRADRARRKADRARRDAERLRERIAAMEGSLWWRLHPGRVLRRRRRQPPSARR